MSANWIKMSVGLRTHPKVVRMASALKADRLRVIGGLWAVWCIFDAHSTDGLLDGYSLQIIDEELAWKGFASAMAGVEWLVEHENGGLEVPRYEEHNGASAKRRAMESDRKAASRAASDDRTKSERVADWKETKSGQTSASDADKLRAREEKRREEENTARAFESFWSAYPRKVGKDAAFKAFSKRRPDDALLGEMLAAIAAQGLVDRCRKGEDRFVPHPSTWLNEGRWTDEPSGQAANGGDIFASAT